MRRVLAIILGVLLIMALSVPVFAAEYASQVNVFAAVSQDESCQVTVTAALHIENNDGNLRFPVPAEATAVSLNGSRVWTTKNDQAQYIDISSALHNMVGDFTITISYALTDVIHTSDAGTPQLQLPLLSGFAYPIDKLDFSVTLPGEITAKPAFSSGYHQANIEKDLVSTVSGATVSGYSATELKDHETLTMTLMVEETLFPNAPLVFYESDFDDIAMIVCAVVALLYWLVFMRCKPSRWRLSTTAPEGVGAGQLGAVMTLGKADLSLMVFSWAQLGYLSIHANRKDKVILQKRMDMGNERTAFEQRCFRNLFGKRNTVDTAGLHYATQCKQVGKMSPNLQPLVHPHSGNAKLFRAISAMIALFGGVCFGIAMTQGAALQGFWVVLTAIAGLVLGWCMQETVHELLLHKGSRTALGIAACLIWLLLGVIADQFAIAVTVLLAQWVAGLMAFFGGRRTEAGRQDLAQIMGLRRYMKTVSKDELRRILTVDPDYFHSLAPFALALGVDRSFARRFGNDRMPVCPYILLGSDAGHTAAEWSDIYRKVLSLMDRRTKMLPLERFLELLALLKK